MAINPFVLLVPTLIGGTAPKRKKRVKQDAQQTDAEAKAESDAPEPAAEKTATPRGRMPGKRTSSAYAAKQRKTRRRAIEARAGLSAGRNAGKPKKRSRRTATTPQQAAPTTGRRVIGGERTIGRLQRQFGPDKIGVSTNGDHGFIGPQWWSAHGRPIFGELRERHPQAAPGEVALALLQQVMPGVDWTVKELPRGAAHLVRRVLQLVEASMMGQLDEDTVPMAPDAEAPETNEEPADVEPSVAAEAEVEAPVEEAQAPQTQPSADAPDEVVTSPEPKKKRGSRGGRRKKAKSTQAKPSPEVTEVSEAKNGEDIRSAAGDGGGTGEDAGTPGAQAASGE